MWPFRVQQILRNTREEWWECLHAAFTCMDFNYTWFGLNIASAKEIWNIFKSWRLSFALTCHSSGLLWGDYECVCVYVCVCAGQENTLGQVMWVNIPLGWYRIPFPACNSWSPCQARGRSDGTFTPWCAQPWLSPTIQMGPLVNTMESRCVSACMCSNFYIQENISMLLLILSLNRHWFLSHLRLHPEIFHLTTWEVSYSSTICISLVLYISISVSGLNTNWVCPDFPFMNSTTMTLETLDNAIKCQ